MRKIKYFFWLIIAAILIVFVYQNKAFFLDSKLLGIDLYFFAYESPKLPVGIYYLAVFLIGLLLSYFFSLAEKFRNKKTIRKLNEQIKASEQQISDLKKQAAPAAATGPSEDEPAPSEQSQKTHSS